MRNVRDYGAVGDGVALDTAAIQRAVDAGGMVYVPEGIYRIGTISLKSHGGLHLAPGAVLLGSMFGPKASGTLIVISNVFASVGGMAGPLLASGVFEGSGSYKGFMLIAAAIYVVYTLFVYFATNKPAMAKLRAMWE